MARGTLSQDERCCLDSNEKLPEKVQDQKSKCDFKGNGLRVRFLDEEGKTERTVSTDEVDCAMVKKIHFIKNRSSSEASFLLRNPSLTKHAPRPLSDSINNNSLSENLNGKISILKFTELDRDKTETPETKETIHFKKNSHVYSVNQAKTLTSERRKSLPLSIPRLLSTRGPETRSTLPAEGGLAAAAVSGGELGPHALGRLARSLGRLLRRTNSVRISDPDPVYKVAYLGNVLTGWARGDSCIEKPLATLWRNYQQSTKPDVVMKLSVTNSGLKGFTKEHGLTEYWSHRVTYCGSPPHYPRLFCWVYRHEGKKLKHELRCHAVLCTKETVSKKITEELQIKLKQALAEFKKDRISKQNARLSLANSVYDNPSMPRRKILLSVGATNYRPPLERSKSAPKLGAIEELCSDEDEEEAEMNAISFSNDHLCTQTLDRRRLENNSTRKVSCPEVADRIRTKYEGGNISDDIINLLVNETNQKRDLEDAHDTSQIENEYHRLESIEESTEITECVGREGNVLLSQNSYLVTDSDDGSVSSGCETASTATSDTEPTSLPSHYPHEELQTKLDSDNEVFETTELLNRGEVRSSKKSCNNLSHTNNDDVACDAESEVNHVPLGEKNFIRRLTYPPLVSDAAILDNFESKFESLIENLADFESLDSCNDNDRFKNTGDNESACSDESGYSELLEGKESVIGNTIMV